MDKRIGAGLAGILVGAVAYWVIDSQGIMETAPAATAASAAEWIAVAETDIEDMFEFTGAAYWVNANFVTYDTTNLVARASQQATDLGVRLANEAKRWNGVELPGDIRRKMNLLKMGLTLPAPDNAADSKELAEITARLDSTYATGKYCRSEDDCLADVDIIQIMANSRDADELLDVWQGWRTISPPMKADYARMVEIANKGSVELGYPDTGALWRAKYDMPAADLPAEADRLWSQVKPLYDSLHCYVRDKLIENYGDAAKTADGTIPAHLLGNIWAQEWGNIFDIVAEGDADPGYNLTKLLQGNGYDPIRIVKTGEAFFTGLGFEPLPETFWERSLFTKPRDRAVQCHASAWDLSTSDYRIKMCIDITGEDFNTVHHELGHNFYQRAYNLKQDVIYRDSAHDGFHEAIGDFIALSVTPAYLKNLGLLQEEPDASRDIGLLLAQALDKVAFLPFGIMIDQWRWKVFSGEATPETYNATWWNLRRQYQGVSAPVERTEENFDPGAKYHIPGNTPYMRYFFARILQFQFHEAACKMAGWDGPLHRCTIAGNQEVGARLNAMLEMGSSRPWPDALEAFTGTREMDGTAIIKYFAPLKTWLDEKNADKTCGWTAG